MEHVEIDFSARFLVMLKYSPLKKPEFVLNC